LVDARASHAVQGVAYALLQLVRLSAELGAH
jgi:hypothetical protein